MNVAIIPARGGSKRIPKKNIKDFCGNPMISYPIKVALKSKIFQRVIVSTDDNEIAKVSESFGAEVPFIRPKNISDDFATTGDVMSHAAKWLKENANHLASVCCIYATAPFIKKDDLIKAYNLFKENKWSFVFSATSFPFPIQRAIKLNEEGGIKMFQPEHFESRSQDLTESYHDAGQFYFGKKFKHLILHVTNHCNFRCSHCFVDFTNPQKDLKFDQYLNISKQRKLI